MDLPINGMVIRIAEEADAEKLLEIYAPYVEKTAITFEYTVPSLEEFRERIRETLKKYPYLIAEKDGEVLGYAYTGAFGKRAAYSWAAETSIYLKENKRRMGVGKQLYTALENISKAQNILNLNACIGYPEEEDAHLTKNSVQFHEHMGYRLAGEFHQCGYKFGTWYNMVWMEKSLGEHTQNPGEVIWFSELRKQVPDLLAGGISADSIYDDERFFEAYGNMERSKGGLEAAGEWHQLKPLFPELKGKTVLDLGCGYGWHCKYAVRMGADQVVGIDGSRRMIDTAKEKNPDKKIQYKVCRIEEFDYPVSAYDFVISNLALHYIEDLNQAYQNIYQTLKPGGIFLFNIEHPVFTAGVLQDWIYGEDKTPLYWPVDRYYEPGQREALFLGEKVVKQHHTLTQILNGLLQTGFQIEAVEEAEPPEYMMDLPGMKDELRRPMMLLVKAKKG